MKYLLFNTTKVNDTSIIDEIQNPINMKTINTALHKLYQLERDDYFDKLNDNIYKIYKRERDELRKKRKFFL